MTLIKHDLFENLFTKCANQLGDDTLTYNGESITCHIQYISQYEKTGSAQLGNFFDIVIEVQKSTIDAIVSSIGKNDIIVFNAKNYNEIVIIENNDIEYVLGAYEVLT